MPAPNSAPSPCLPSAPDEPASGQHQDAACFSYPANDLAAQDSSTALLRRLRRYCNPALLVIDEVGYLSYDPRAGDLLFEVVSRRHEQKAIVLTTNRPFAEWDQVFPNASCVTALVDRLVHRAEIVSIEGQSYRAKEAKERAERKAKERGDRRTKTRTAKAKAT